MKFSLLALCALGISLSASMAQAGPLDTIMPASAASAKSNSCPSGNGACALSPFKMMGRFMLAVASTNTPPGMGMRCRVTAMRQIGPVAMVMGL
jgi:hypothetical protein